MPTVLSINVNDFCKVMYDKNQYWFKYWTQYIINDVKDKCVNSPGVGLDSHNLYIFLITLKFQQLHCRRK